jgi:hypothetical protein
MSRQVRAAPLPACRRYRGRAGAAGGRGVVVAPLRDEALPDVMALHQGEPVRLQRISPRPRRSPAHFKLSRGVK